MRKHHMQAAGPPDVYAFYLALHVELPEWAVANASVRCFADPDAHAHADRSPSCSVSLDHGAWRCWACGAQGGAYDAALARGHTPSSAMELLREHGLAGSPHSAHSGSSRSRPESNAPGESAGRAPRPPFAVTDEHVEKWSAALLGEAGQAWRARLAQERRWSATVMRELELGYDGTRITIPIRSAWGRLRGVLRYRPAANPKMLAAPGTRLGLVPHPVTERSRRILLVEGPPDMIAARSEGWPAIAVPGDHAWQSPWAQLLARREVIVVMDSDNAGRGAAERITADLDGVAAVRVVDLAPERADGFDLTDWLLAHRQQGRVRWRASSSLTPMIKP